MFPVATLLFIFTLIAIWFFLVGVKAHDNLGNKAKEFTENNLKQKGENENE